MPCSLAVVQGPCGMLVHTWRRAQVQQNCSVRAAAPAGLRRRLCFGRAHCSRACRSQKLTQMDGLKWHMHAVHSAQVLAAVGGGGRRSAAGLAGMKVKQLRRSCCRCAGCWRVWKGTMR